MTWERNFATWAEVDVGFDGVDIGCRQLTDALKEDGAVAVDEVRIQVSTQHSAPGERLVALSECRGLVLRHPNPMPRFRPFRWLPQ